ncbi:MAG: site-specific DNA-methyltransferase [Deferribacteraceae bacterium]|jgi:DNA modification methylase|nr:site-specific DNA-methyltransferase [Deferribacteraceae bacterium]
MDDISSLEIDYSWSFSDKTTKDTSYLTHGYYTYPAKFIPQLAARLIHEYSHEGDIVIDPFMGSGTTVVESILNNRIGIGADINEIAYLAAAVKSTPLDNQELVEASIALEHQLVFSSSKTPHSCELIRKNEDRIDYWFLPEQKEELLYILTLILEIKDKKIKDFFLIAFAQILKSCSIWLQRSIKPTRDKCKKVNKPIELFLRQAKKMILRHVDFNRRLDKDVKNKIDSYRIIKCGDSRELPCKDESAALAVTSPPYVTSYEYADLHQLPLLWLGYLDELADFRKKFIGSAHKTREAIDMKSETANSIVAGFGKNKKGVETRNYFSDMLESFIELKRVLRKGGKACIVIGNTEFKGVKILNAEVFLEQFENIGFRTCNLIHREIPSKMLPSTRDVTTGQFTKCNKDALKLAYPTEYILVVEKL